VGGELEQLPLLTITRFSLEICADMMGNLLWIKMRVSSKRCRILLYLSLSVLTAIFKVNLG